MIGSFGVFINGEEIYCVISYEINRNCEVGVVKVNHLATNPDGITVYFNGYTMENTSFYSEKHVEIKHE